MTSPIFVSYAQNGEDVVVHRALGQVEDGRYVEVGANDPVIDSVTYALYDRGWSGIAIEPVPAYAARLREARPRDQIVEAAITAEPVDSVTLHQIPNTGLSTLVDGISKDHELAGWTVEDVEVPARRLGDVLEEAGWAGQDMHLMVIDTEGTEQSVLESIDLRVWRPWVLIIESTRPRSSDPTHESWEPMVLAADYRFCLFDGLSRFYVAAERWEQLHDALSHPADALDNFRLYGQVRAEQAERVLTDELAVRRAELTELKAQIDRLREQQLVQEQEYTAAVLEWRTAAVKALARAGGSNYRADLNELLARNHLQVNHIGVVDAELKRARAEITALRDELDAVHATLSWRVTTPLRKARGFSRGPRS